MMSKLYSNPLNPNQFIPKEEYFKILNSKLYDKHLDELNKPLAKINSVNN